LKVKIQSKIETGVLILEITNSRWGAGDINQCNFGGKRDERRGKRDTKRKTEDRQLERIS
jgi:hypothetical protein